VSKYFSQHSTVNIRFAPLAMNVIVTF